MSVLRLILMPFAKQSNQGEAVYTPVLGWHNCPANLDFTSEGNFSKKKSGEFETTSFVKSGDYKFRFDAGEFRIGFEKLPNSPK